LGEENMNIRICSGVIALFSIGCSTDKESTEDIDTQAEGWWDNPEEGDEEEPDDFDDEEGDGLLSFEWSVDPGTGTGIFDGTYGNCNAYGEVVNAIEVEDCSGCSLSMSMNYQSLSFTGEGCEAFQEMEEITEIYGHGEEVIYEYDGYNIHGLYMIDEEEGDNWVEVQGGYSLIIEDIWYFGIDL
jgi:hypothetical protein